jgi:hypothetical protein
MTKGGLLIQLQYHETSGIKCHISS